MKAVEVLEIRAAINEIIAESAVHGLPADRQALVYETIEKQIHKRIAVDLLNQLFERDRSFLLQVLRSTESITEALCAILERNPDTEKLMNRSVRAYRDECIAALSSSVEMLITA